jgi:uncharacterized protein YndB with AHSA1/START domain
MSAEVVHGSFTIERRYVASPARVFGAFAHEGTKRSWFAHEDVLDMLEFSLDFRVGGRETSRFSFVGAAAGGPPKGTPMSNDATYLDIVPNERIVFSNVLSVADRHVVASLVTVQLLPAGKGTRLVLTEQSAFFDRLFAREADLSDAVKLREEGFRQLLARIDGVLGPERDGD